MEKLIEIKNLNFSYEDELILKKVNLDIYDGDFAVLIGSNGSGKSTLFKLIIRELKKTSGSIKLFNKNIEKFNEWSKIGYVPQVASSIFKGFPTTVEEFIISNLYKQIGYLRFPNKKHKNMVNRVLSEMGILDLMKKNLSDLSGGQQQKVLIARVLINKPKILLLDEPTIGIDRNSLFDLYNILYKLNKDENLTIFMITHEKIEMLNYINKAFCIEFNDILELDKTQLEEELEHKHKHINKTEDGNE